MTDVDIRREGWAGRITLRRPAALNALTWDMVLAIDAALAGWAADAAVALVIIDAEGDRAFCAGGDIAALYRAGMAGDFGHGQQFWRDEYRMNARIAGYRKPVVSLMQGFCMGGGVGLGCHARLRIVGETARLAMPECAIGLIPDVGGSRLLARAPDGFGWFLGATGARMGPGDAVHAGFADAFVPEAGWPALIAAMVASGRLPVLTAPPPARSLWPDDAAVAAARVTASPLAIACFAEVLRRLGPDPSIAAALRLEYRFVHRAQQHSDFLEGIRAAVIDRDRAPRWRHAGTEGAVTAMLAPLETELDLEGVA